jgi:chromosome segregation ATPase
VLQYQKKVAGVTSTLRDSQIRLIDQVRDVAALDDPKQGRQGKRGESSAERTPSVRVDLRLHLEDIDRKVHQMTETNTLLEGSLGKIKSELKLAGDERDQIIKTRMKLRERVSELEEHLDDARVYEDPAKDDEQEDDHPAPPHRAGGNRGRPRRRRSDRGSDGRAWSVAVA